MFRVIPDTKDSVRVCSCCEFSASVTINLTRSRNPKFGELRLCTQCRDELIELLMMELR